MLPATALATGAIGSGRFRLLLRAKRGDGSRRGESVRRRCEKPAMVRRAKAEPGESGVKVLL